MCFQKDNRIQRYKDSSCFLSFITFSIIGNKPSIFGQLRSMIIFERALLIDVPFLCQASRGKQRSYRIAHRHPGDLHLVDGRADQKKTGPWGPGLFRNSINPTSYDSYSDFIRRISF